jgi:ADP-ribosylglycohydrolase
MRSFSKERPDPSDEWMRTWNRGTELCGATIRVDPFGLACPGRPALAAELAWRDASWTHRRTGIYGAMFVAAAIAAAFVERDRLAIFRTALQHVPRRSRFHEITADCMKMVAEARDWLEGYERIHGRYNAYAHCRIYQEVGTVINTVRFAPNVGEGICMQVSQGCDTDCFGKIAGAILGAYFGPGHLEERWLAPFGDRFHSSVATFHEQSLSAVADRMAVLSRFVAEQP